MTSEPVPSEKVGGSDASARAARYDPPAGQGTTGKACPPTARESELIALIARGLPNKVIAYEMGISPYTVRAHIGNIMRKYQLHNRTQIAMLLTPLITIAANRRRSCHRSIPGRTGIGDPTAEGLCADVDIDTERQAGGRALAGTDRE